MSTLKNIEKIDNIFDSIGDEINQKYENAGFNAPVGECTKPEEFPDMIKVMPCDNGSGGIDPGAFSATVINVIDSEKATADVNLNNGLFAFSFGLPKGLDGKPGADGTNYQRIYKRMPTLEENPPETPYSDPDDDKGSVGIDGWTETPTGVDRSWKIEYLSERSKKDGKWGEYSTPSQYSVYSKAGRDGNGYEYIFKLTKDENEVPRTPIAPSDSLDDSFPSDWNDDPISPTKELKVCWISIRKQKYLNDLQKWGPYTKPVVWTRFGTDGIGGKTVFVFTAAKEESEKPMPPVGGKWNPDSNLMLELPIDPEGKYIWTENNDIKGNYIWVSTGLFNGNGDLIETWNDPFCMTGANGEPGVDGAKIQFIYKLVKDKKAFKNLKAPTEQVEVPEGWTDNPTGIDGENFKIEAVCSRKQDELTKEWGNWVGPVIWASWGEDGTDGAGIEYVFQITATANDRPPIVNYDAIKNDPLLNKIYQLPGFVPGSVWIEAYIKGHPELSPEDQSKIRTLDSNWTDEPSDIGPDEPIEWVSIRKQKIISGEKSDNYLEWGNFSEPKKWASFAGDGVSVISLYCFAVTDDDISKATIEGLTYNTRTDLSELKTTLNGAPYTITWHDTLPENSDTDNVWMIFTTLSSNTPDELADWTSPKKMIDSNLFQVEYSAASTLMSTEKGLKSLNDIKKQLEAAGKPTDSESLEKAWRADPTNKDWNWGDSDTVKSPNWMATCSLRNGKWSNWSLALIKGEKGDPGDPGKDGNSITVKGKFATQEELKTAWEYCEDPSSHPNLPKDKQLATCPAELGDAYSVGQDLWLYDGSGSTFEECWQNLGPFKGDPGDSFYMYIRYSNDKLNFTDRMDQDSPLGTTPGIYIGFILDTKAHDPNSFNPSDFNWVKWMGDDGFGIEQIFLLSRNAPNVPKRPTNVEDPEYMLWNTQDYCPLVSAGSSKRWSDVPLTPTKTEDCWMCTRKFPVKEGADWKGDKDTGKAILYNQYLTNAIHAELTNDTELIPCDSEGVPDSDLGNNLASTSIMLFDGDDEIHDGLTYSVKGIFNNRNYSITNTGNIYHVIEVSSGNSVIDITISNNKFLISKFDLDKANIEIAVKFNGKEYTKIFTVSKSKNGMTVYKLAIDKNIIKIDKDSRLPLNDYKTITAEVQKWVEDKYDYSHDGIKIFVKYKRTTDSNYITINNNDSDNLILDISDFRDLVFLQFYITADNSPTGLAIDKETIGIVKDGDDGPEGPQGPQGNDGTSVTIKGEYESESELNQAWENQTLVTNPPLPGDGYIIKGDLWVFDGSKFTNVGKIQGDPGESAYLYIRYSDDGGKNFTGKLTPDDYNGTVPGVYIGFIQSTTKLSDTVLNNPKSFAWMKWMGDDGFGQEQIFKLGTNNDIPLIPVKPEGDQDWYKPDHIPSGWSDKPLSPTKENPCCWMVIRKFVNGVMGEWLGDSNGKAILFTYKAIDGTKGRVPYPAGKWNSTTTYTRGDGIVPYVMVVDENGLKKGYYILEADSSFNQDPETYSSIWTKVEEFSALFAEIALIDNGRFGKFIFSGNKLFSEDGYDKIGKIDTTFDTISSRSNFDPNVSINSKTGEAWFAKHRVLFESSGSGYIGKYDRESPSGITWDTEGHVTINSDVTINGTLTIGNVSGLQDELTRIENKIGEGGGTSQVDFLGNTFKDGSTIITGGATITGGLFIKNSSENIIAGLNSKESSEISGSIPGRNLIFFSGAKGISNSTVNDATAEIYDDGTTKLAHAEFNANGNGHIGRKGTYISGGNTIEYPIIWNSNGTVQIAKEAMGSIIVDRLDTKENENHGKITIEADRLTAYSTDSTNVTLPLVIQGSPLGSFSPTNYIQNGINLGPLDYLTFESFENGMGSYSYPFSSTMTSDIISFQSNGGPIKILLGNEKSSLPSGEKLQVSEVACPDGLGPIFTNTSYSVIQIKAKLLITVNGEKRYSWVLGDNTFDPTRRDYFNGAGLLDLQEDISTVLENFKLKSINQTIKTNNGDFIEIKITYYLNINLQEVESQFGKPGTIIVQFVLDPYNLNASNLFLNTTIGQDGMRIILDGGHYVEIAALDYRGDKTQYRFACGSNNFVMTDNGIYIGLDGDVISGEPAVRKIGISGNNLTVGSLIPLTSSNL